MRPKSRLIMTTIIKTYCVQALPNPADSRIALSIFTLNSSYDKSPHDLEKVMLKSHVEALGKQSSLVKQMPGVSKNPQAGSLLEPEKNWMISDSETVGLSCLLHSSTYSFQLNIMASSGVRELLP